MEYVDTGVPTPRFDFPSDFQRFGEELSTAHEVKEREELNIILPLQWDGILSTGEGKVGVGNTLQWRNNSPVSLKMFHTLTESSSDVSRTHPANLFTEGKEVQIFKDKTSYKGLDCEGKRGEKAQVVFEFLPSCFSVQVTLITSW